MNKYTRDLALDLHRTYGLKPEDISCKGGICYDIKTGEILSKDYFPLVGITNDEVYEFEINN